MRWLLTSLAVAFLSCCGPSDPMKPGDLYSVDDGDGGFKVSKVLANHDGTIHIRIYKNTWEIRPESIDSSELSLGSINDADGFGIGHLPLDRQEFENWNPVLIRSEELSADELEGYQMWLDVNG